jgi:pyruvate formate lyase activating enzyme
MKIGGFEGVTLVDFPGRVACIVYTVGCMFRCKMCYNPDILSEDLFIRSGRRLIPEKEILRLNL